MNKSANAIIDRSGTRTGIVAVIPPASALTGTVSLELALPVTVVSATPLVSVTSDAGDTVASPVFVEVKVTVSPDTGFPPLVTVARSVVV